ncbi:MAG: large subunit ribosomal protein L18 [Parcubacteria group bacterium Licking1014_1]|nr:MAG: large subunit ribosomal protein L18 [Parcubacteria group bacterium Licking1014_1]
MQEKQSKRERRHKKIRARIYGTQDRPRLFVFRSINHIYGQLIDDDKEKVLLSVSDKDLKKGKDLRKTNIAREVGKLIAEKAAAKSIEKVVFDRGGIIFHGRVKALAEGAREGGLKF